MYEKELTTNNIVLRSIEKSRLDSDSSQCWYQQPIYWLTPIGLFQLARACKGIVALKQGLLVGRQISRVVGYSIPGHKGKGGL